MREILFKAKRKLDGAWVVGDLSQHKTGKKFIKLCGGSATHSFEVDENTICQYTGLIDKNGNMIWENDIVIYDNSPYNVYCTPHKGEIACRNGSLCFKYWLYGSINYMPFTSDLFFDRKCEVIGNIFDNTDLLKGE